jgi:hypothetical protein
MSNGGFPVEGERIQGIVYGAEGRIGRLGLVKTYDLIFTDRRLVGAVVAKTGAARVIGGSLGGAIGGAIAAAVSKSGADNRRASYTGMPLDNIVASDKANFTTPYTSIENARVKGVITKYLHMHVAGKKALFKVPKQQLDAARSLIASRLPGAKV